MKKKVRPETPISGARNLGTLTAGELNSIGIKSLEQMRELGWQEVCFRYSEAFPKRLNLNAFSAIIGAINNQDWRAIDPKLKEEARKMVWAFKGQTS